MPKRRQTRVDLPPRVYNKHGAYYFVTPENKWLRLGASIQEALAAHARLVQSDAPILTVNDAIRKYRVEVLPTKAPRTQSDNLKELDNLIPVFGEMALVDVRPVHIVQYLSRRSAKVRANREIALLSHVFSKAMSWGAIDRNPCYRVEKNDEFPRDRYVEDHELAAFRAHAPTWLQNYLDLRVLLGLRQADLIAMKRKQLTERGILVPLRKSGRGAQRRNRRIMLFEWTPELRSIVETILGQPLIFDSNGVRGRGEGEAQLLCGARAPLTASSLDNGFDRTWERIRKKEAETGAAPLEHFREHDLRAKTGTDADEAGLDATAILGHADAKTTQTYLRSRKPVTVRPLSKSTQQVLDFSGAQPAQNDGVLRQQGSPSR